MISEKSRGGFFDLQVILKIKKLPLDFWNWKSTPGFWKSTPGFWKSTPGFLKIHPWILKIHPWIFQNPPPGFFRNLKNPPLDFQNPPLDFWNLKNPGVDFCFWFLKIHPWIFEKSHKIQGWIFGFLKNPGVDFEFHKNPGVDFENPPLDFWKLQFLLVKTVHYQNHLRILRSNKSTSPKPVFFPLAGILDLRVAEQWSTRRLKAEALYYSNMISIKWFT